MTPLQKTATLEQTVADFLRGRRVISGKPLLVAVSGGPDSVCLLLILNSLRKELGLKLHVAHLDHMLRGKESVGDAQYVLDLCHKLGVPVTIEQRNVRAYAKERRLTLEEAAREVRYAFLADVAESIGATTVVVGHTLDDHAETVLLHIVRGTGTRGLRGLQPLIKRQSNGRSVTIIRPLIGVTRSETAAYCRRHRLQPRADTTNLSKKFLRNRVRLELLPLLETYNPRIVEALLRTARIAADDVELLEKEARRQWRRVARREGDAIILDKALMSKTAPGIQRALLRMALDEILGTLKDIEGRHIEEMLEALTKPAGKSIDLPYGLRFMVEHDRLVLTGEAEKLSPSPPLVGQHTIAVPGLTEIPGWCITTEVLASAKGTGGSLLTEVFDRDHIRGGLVVRPRHSGDRFQPLGMDEEKKVGRFMMDEHIPQAWRSRVPLVCDGDKVLWVVGYRIDERVKVTEATKRVLRMQFERR